MCYKSHIPFEENIFVERNFILNQMIDFKKQLLLATKLYHRYQLKGSKFNKITKTTTQKIIDNLPRKEPSIFVIKRNLYTQIYPSPKT